jgi:hypothetical protein
MPNFDLFSMIDEVVKAAYSLTDEEYDTMVHNMSDEDLDLFTSYLSETPTFAEKRKRVELKQKYLNK